MGLEVREWDQLVNVIVVATVMLALLAVGLAYADRSRLEARTALAVPAADRLEVPRTREGLLRALVRDLK